MFEVWQPSAGGEPVVRFVFKNGTNDEFRAYPFLNSSAPVPVSSVVSALTPISFADLPTWCKMCANTQDRGCGALAAAANQSKTVFIGSHDKVSPVGAGFIGAAVMLVVLLGSLALLSFAGVLRFGKRSSSRRLGSDVCDSKLLNLCFADIFVDSPVDWIGDTRGKVISHLRCMYGECKIN